MFLSIAIYIMGAWTRCFEVQSWEDQLNLDNLRIRWHTSWYHSSWQNSKGIWQEPNYWGLAAEDISWKSTQCCFTVLDSSAEILFFVLTVDLLALYHENFITLIPFIFHTVFMSV